MRSTGVVMLLPGRGQLLRFAQGVEVIHFEELVAQAAVEGFGVAVLPGGAWFDVERLHARLRKPCAHFSGDEFRTVIGTDVSGNAVLRHQGGEHVKDGVGREGTLYFKRKVLARELVQDHQELQLPPVHTAVMDEIPGPHVVAAGGRAFVAGVTGIARGPLFMAFSRHFEAFPLPEPGERAYG